jgi:hypothetical protein
MMMEKLVERLAGGTEVLGENLLQCRFVHRKPHMLSGCEPGPPRWKSATNRLSYGTERKEEEQEKKENNKREGEGRIPDIKFHLLKKGI